jgi:glycosyltransferase involved in cell wall biosynthesis
MKNTKTIAVNAVGVKDTFAGIGNLTFYTFNELALLTPNKQFHIYVSTRMQDKFRFTALNITIHQISLPFNSIIMRILWDQLICPFISLKHGLFISMMNAACILSQTKQITFIYDLADICMPERFSKKKVIYLKVLRYFTIRVSKQIITISDSTKRDFILHYPEFKELVKVIPLGCKKNISHTQAEANKVETLTDKDYFLFVSTIEPGKNIPRLLHAFEIFLRSHPTWNLIIIGSKSWGYPAVESTLRELKIDHAVQCLGYVSDQILEQLYKNASAFTFPSLYEGFGLPVLEAMQYYIPVLTSNVSSLPEVGGEGVVYCNPTDINDIAKGMEKLLTLKRSDYEEAYNKQLSYYTWENGAKTLKDIINTVLEK